MSPDLDSGSWIGYDSSAADVCISPSAGPGAARWSLGLGLGPEREQVPPDHLGQKGVGSAETAESTKTRKTTTALHQRGGGWGLLLMDG